MRSVWPYAKHQLCFWHGLRAVKQRLSKNKDPPAKYNVEDAIEEFPFIDPFFVPFMQQSPEKSVSEFTLESRGMTYRYIEDTKTT